MSVSHRFTSLFDAIDAMDVDRFAEHLTPDVRFAYGSREPVEGKPAVVKSVTAFFDAFGAIRHEVERVLECGRDRAVVEGLVTYVTHGGRTVTVPFANVFSMQGNVIRDYRIYVDPTPLAE
jgi:ketosteroid isomerase-like protein